MPNIKYIDLKTNGIVNIFTLLPNNSHLKFEIGERKIYSIKSSPVTSSYGAFNDHTWFLLLMVLRNQIKPIKTLASAAEAFGKGQSLSYKPTGSIEIRKAGSAFLEMRKELRDKLNNGRKCCRE